MELEWPLILFTTFIAWSAGLFATQGYAVIKGEGAKTHMTALITSFVLMAIGGIAVFFHLQHWERIFNGFGHLTSGITQELIAIVVLVAAMVVLFVFLRKNPEKVPSWVGIVAIVVSIALVIVMGHSYMMAAHPTWDNIVEILSLIGSSCIMGPATWAVLATVKGEPDSSFMSQTMLVGAIVDLVTTVGYVAVMAAAVSQITQISYYFDPTSPTKDVTATTGVSPFTSGSLAVTLLTIVCAIIPIVAAVMGKKSGNWKVWGAVALVSGFVACLLLRVVFYQMGLSIYPFY